MVSESPVLGKVTPSPAVVVSFSTPMTIELSELTPNYRQSMKPKRPSISIAEESEQAPSPGNFASSRKRRSLKLSAKTSALPSFDEEAEDKAAAKQEGNKFAQNGIFVARAPSTPTIAQSTPTKGSPISNPSPTTPQSPWQRPQADQEDRQATSGVLVSWLAHCHEHGQAAYSPDLLGLVEFLADGHKDCGWDHKRMEGIAEVVKGAIQRSHGFEAFEEEDLLDDILRIAKSVEVSQKSLAPFKL